MALWLSPYNIGRIKIEMWLMLYQGRRVHTHRSTQYLQFGEVGVMLDHDFAMASSIKQPLCCHQ